MLLKSQIEEIISFQNEKNHLEEIEVAREQLKQVPKLLKFASIITGIRRCGKSTLMNQIRHSFKENETLYLNFDDINLTNFETNDFTRLHRIITERSPKVIFFDEPQLVNGWEVFVHQLLRENYYVYLSGSNASMPSTELGTHLTGRHISTELFPFSYNEYLSLKHREKSVESFTDYLKDGGMPEYIKTYERKVLQSLLDDILIRDIAIRKGIKNVEKLKSLALYMLTNIARPFTANRLSSLIECTTATIIDYIDYMRDAYLIDTIGIFSTSMRATMRNPKKVYAIDNGIVSVTTFSQSKDWERLLENYQFICLRKKYKSHIFYFKNNEGECDFVVTDDNNHPTALYQVCWNLNDENFRHETGGLIAAMKATKLNEGYLVTLNDEDEFHYSEGTIHVVKAF